MGGLYGKCRGLIVVGGVVVALLVGLSYDSCGSTLNRFDPCVVSFLIPRHISHRLISFASCSFGTDEKFVADTSLLV